MLEVKGLRNNTQLGEHCDRLPGRGEEGREGRGIHSCETKNEQHRVDGLPKAMSVK